MDVYDTIIVMVATEPSGVVRTVLWFNEGNFESTKSLALNRAISWCVNHKVDVDFLDREPLQRTHDGWRMLVASGPPLRVELWGSMKTL